MSDNPDRKFAAVEVRSGCPSGNVPGARWQRLRDIFFVEPTGTSLPQAMGVWATDFLIRELPEKQDGIWVWADTINLTAAGYTAWCVALQDITSASPAPVLVIAGGRYVAVTKIRGAFDLDEGIWLSHLPDDIFESRVFSLKMLYRHCLGSLEDVNRSASRPGVAGS